MRKLRHTEVQGSSHGYIQETCLAGHLRPVHSGYRSIFCQHILRFAVSEMRDSRDSVQQKCGLDHRELELDTWIQRACPEAFSLGELSQKECLPRPSGAYLGEDIGGDVHFSLSTVLSCLK